MPAPIRPRYQSVVLDVDSTLCGVEGIDWLARLRGERVADESRRLTDRAMNGELRLDAVYGERLALIRPSRAEVERLGDEYQRTVAPTAADNLSAMRDAGARLVLISGGLRRAILPVALGLGFEEHDVFAVDLRWDEAGNYIGFDTESPLTTQSGKLTVLRGLALEPLVLAVGDGSTDVPMRGASDAFAAFTGFVERKSVVEQADLVLRDYDELRRVVLPAT